MQEFLSALADGAEGKPNHHLRTVLTLSQGGGDQFNFYSIISATLLGISSHTGDSKFIIFHNFTSSKLKGKNNIACEFNCQPCKLSCVSSYVPSVPQVTNGSKVSPGQMFLVPLSEHQSISCEESKHP